MPYSRSILHHTPLCQPVSKKDVDPACRFPRNMANVGASFGRLGHLFAKNFGGPLALKVSAAFGGTQPAMLTGDLAGVATGGV
jgi:hypothetical protein